MLLIYNFISSKYFAPSILMAVSIMASQSIYAEAKQKTKPDSISDVERIIDIQQVEHRGDHRLRIYFNASEKSESVFYPITTIERNMVSVDFHNTSVPPAPAKSLSIVGGQSTDIQRSLFIGFNLDKTLSGRELSEVRARIAEIIADLPSENLSVVALANGSARIVADMTPEKTDNVNRIQQQIAALPADGEGPVLGEMLCVANDKISTWNTSHYKRSDQKIAIILSPEGDSTSTEKYRVDSCFRNLVDSKVKIFHIAFGQSATKPQFDLSHVIQESGGFIHRVASPLDILAATKNVISILKNEYILDVDAPDVSLEDQPLELTVKVSYHDTILKSNVFNVGFVIPALATILKSTPIDSNQSSAEIQATIVKQRKMQFALIVTGILCLIGAFYIVFARIKRRFKTTKCNTCNDRVYKNYSNCQFRHKDCVGRLVVLNGPQLGQTLPLMRGANPISVFGKTGIRLSMASRIRWLNHGCIRIENSRIAYEPKKGGVDFINGWPVPETKLLGQGHLLQLGKVAFRVEINPKVLM
jgi:hypothetical protein